MADVYDIRLINMPFASLQIPSLGLTQLQAVVRQRFADEASVRVHYLNHDFARFLGIAPYQEICGLAEHQASGLGDWLFRQAAFPDLPDNAEEFLLRYYPTPTPEWQRFRRFVVEVRGRLPGFLTELIRRYDLLSADLVGFTSMFQQNVASFALARHIKDQHLPTVVVLGGANAEAPMGQELLRGVPQLDYVFSGSALRTFPDLIQALREGDPARADRIHGVFSRTNVDNVVDLAGAGDPARLPLRPGAIFPMGAELDINADIELDYDAFLADVRRNFPDGRIRPVLLFETSRGCWWGEAAHCTFCGLNGSTMKYRSLRADKAVATLTGLFERYGEHCQQFMCVDNIMPREYLTEVFPHLNTPSGVSIFYEVKADLSYQELRVMTGAGVVLVQPGIESLATSILKLMRKGVSALRNISFLLSCVRTGVYPTWNLLVGFPGEAEAVYQKYTVDMPRLTHLPAPTGVYPVRFDRYSPYFKDAEEYGLDLAPLEYYGYTYPMRDGALRNAAYYFYDRNRDAPYAKLAASWLDELGRLVREWQQGWHGRGRVMPARLYLDGPADQPSIVDSRSGSEERHPVEPADRELLAYLAEPRRLDRVDGYGPDTDERLARFRDRGWLFEEGNRAVSLVIPERPPTPTYLRQRS